MVGLLKFKFLSILQSWISKNAEADANLNLFNVTKQDEGEYLCRANNFVGRAEKSFWLHIHKPEPGNSSTLSQRLRSCTNEPKQLKTARRYHQYSSWAFCFFCCFSFSPLP